MLVLHVVRSLFFEQHGTVEQHRAELFSRLNLGETMEEGDAEIALRQCLFHVHCQDYVSARQAYESTNGTIAYQTSLTFPAFVDVLEGVLSIEQMREKYQRLLSEPNRNELGIVAHFDWAIARLLGLRELAKQKGRLLRSDISARFRCGSRIPAHRISHDG